MHEKHIFILDTIQKLEDQLMAANIREGKKLKDQVRQAREELDNLFHQLERHSRDNLQIAVQYLSPVEQLNKEASSIPIFKPPSVADFW